MKLNILLRLMAAAMLAAASNVMAQSTNTVESANAAETVQSQLQELVLHVQTKAQAGKHDEADYADELKTLDGLIASKKDAKTDEAVQFTYMKAMLYLQVIRATDKGADILRQIITNYPNTEYSASAAKLVAKVAKMQDAEKTHAGLVAGSVCPDFAVTNLQGGPMSIGALKGKVVLVDFWATWCPPCRAELPNVIATYKKHHSDGFEIIGVSLDEERNALDEFLKQQDGMTWPQYFDGQKWDNQLAVKYGVDAIPFAMLIGRDGKIIGTELRGEELEDAVTKAVAAR